MSSESIDAEGKHKLDVDGLAMEWEQSREIRSHLLQDGAVLFCENLNETVKTSCQSVIYEVLAPVLARMKSTQGCPQPAVEPLREELSKLYKSCCKNKSADDSDVVHDSWMVRKFLGLVKMKARIKKPSTAIWMQFVLTKLKTSYTPSAVFRYASIEPQTTFRYI